MCICAFEGGTEIVCVCVIEIVEDRERDTDWLIKWHADTDTSSVTTNDTNCTTLSARVYSSPVQSSLLSSYLLPLTWFHPL